MENIILPPDSVLNDKTSILSQLPKKDFDKLIEGSFRELGNFDAIEVPKTLQLEEFDYDLESKWKLNELNRANSPSNLFKVEESRLKSWENRSTMNLFDGRVVDLGELTTHNRFDDIGDDENDEESGNNTDDIHLNSSILNESSLISSESEYRSNYLSWDETLNIKQNLRVSDNKFKKLKLIYDELNLDYIESNEINVINISEEELIKEVLLLLQLNPNYLFEFNVDQNYFELNMSSDVQFDQSTQEALDLYSTQFLKFSTNWIRLDLVTKTLMELPEIYGQLGLCFAQCLSNYLQLIQFSIIKLSEVENLKPAKLSQEIQEMEEILSNLTKLCNCQIDLNLQDLEDPIKLEIIQFGFYLPKKSNLLSYLYEVITLNYNTTPTLLDFIYIAIFKECSKIWFNWINEVLSIEQIGGGNLEDPYNEFFIQFNEISDEDELNGDNSIFMREFGFIQEDNIPKIHFFSKGIPQLFSLQLGQSVLSGAKCLRLLKILSSNTGHMLQEQLKYDSINWDIWSTYTMESDADITNRDYFDRVRENLGLIRENGIFDLISQFPITLETSFLTTLDELISRADNISKTTLFFEPIPSTVYKSIYTPILDITQKIEAFTMKEIIKDQSFKDNFKLIECLFLFQEGSQLALFIKETLHSVRNMDNLIIQNSISLQKQINSKFNNYLNNLDYSLNLTSLLKLDVDFISSTNRALKFELNYNLPFPLNQLISSTTLSSYKKLFTFQSDLIQFELSLTKLYAYSKQLLYSNSEIKSFLVTLSNLLQFCKYWMFTSNQVLIRGNWRKFKSSLNDEESNMVTKFIEDHSNLISSLVESILLEKSLPTLMPSLYTIIYEVINFELKLNQSTLIIDNFLEFEKLLKFYLQELDKLIRIKCSGEEGEFEELAILKGLI